MKRSLTLLQAVEENRNILNIPTKFVGTAWGKSVQ